MLRRFSGRVAGCLLAAGVAVLGLAGPAAAHVTVVPEQAVQGDYAKLTFRVPNESDTAGTVRVRVDLPTDTPFPSVSTKPNEGWRAETVTTEFDEPVPAGDVDVEEAVTSVTWTAEAGVAIDPGEFEEFEISVGPLPEEKETLTFPAVQTYSDDTVVRWDEVSEEGGTEPEHPAPALELIPASEGDTGSAGTDDTGNSTGNGDEDDMERSAGQSESVQSQAVDSTARTLAAAGLGAGVLSLIVLGLFAVSLRRRNTAQSGSEARS